VLPLNTIQTRQPHRPGFTLTELLIVLAILAMLMTMVVPAVQRGAAVARRANCAKKLRAICEAYQIRIQSDLLGPDKRFDVNNSWAIQLRNQVGAHVRAFYCVEDPAPRKAASLPRMERRWDGNPEGAVPLQLFDAEPVWEEGPLSDYGTSGPGVWKVNQEVYSELSLQQGVSQIDELPQYEPGSNPDVYYMLINDEGSAGGDADYEDLIFKVENESDGTVTMTMEHLGYTVFTHDLYGPLLEVKDIGKTANGEYLFESHGPISYGMTSLANRRGFATRTVLALDFKKDVIHPNMDEPSEEWDEFNAPRHLGECNIVFAEGSVEGMRPDEISMGDPTIREKYWDRQK